MLRRVVALVLLGVVLAAVTAGAQEGAPDKPLDDPAQEARAVSLHKEIRCLVCQNQSIAESNAELARDLRQLVRERIAAGDSDQAVSDFLVARYGDWVLLAPPFRARTWLLWLGPAVVLLLAGLGVLVWYRRSGANPVSAAPLSAAERRRLEGLLEDQE